MAGTVAQHSSQRLCDSKPEVHDAESIRLRMLIGDPSVPSKERTRLRNILHSRTSRKRRSVREQQLKEEAARSAGLEAHNQMLEATVAELGSEVEALTHVLQEQDEMIQQFRRELEETRAQLARLQQQQQGQASVTTAKAVEPPVAINVPAESAPGVVSATPEVSPMAMVPRMQDDAASLTQLHCLLGESLFPLDEPEQFLDLNDKDV